jgi:formylglycine-generating enzyme required for sulfatase activity
MGTNHLASSKSWFRFGLTLAFAVFCVGAIGQNGVEQLLSAADKGDVKAIQAAIAAGVDVEATDAAGYTALMKAANGGKLEAVRALLKAGAKVNARSKQGFTPLMASVASGNVAIAKLLLDGGADASAMTPSGMTALDGAKRTGNQALIQLLSKVTPTASAQPVPPPPPLPKAAISKQQIDAKTEQAAQAFKAGEYGKATALFQEVAAINPQDALVWHFLGQSLAKTNDVMGARRAFAKALEIQPDGELADRTRNMLAKLPEPDLSTFKLDDGLTLGDWLPVAEQQAAQGKESMVLGQIKKYLDQFGPVPQLLALQEKVQKNAQAAQEKSLQGAIAGISLVDTESAKSALPRIRQLRQDAPQSLTLLRLEAKACHLLQDFACAEADYAAWLKATSVKDPSRKPVVAALMQAKQHEALSNVQEEMYATGEIIRDCPECPEMVVISAGSFQMGAVNEKHTVTFKDSFAIGKTEVTQAQWKAVMSLAGPAAAARPAPPAARPGVGGILSGLSGAGAANPSSPGNPSNFAQCGDNCPVENVSWNDAQEFIQKLNVKTGKHYRLPTSAEWEAACRGGKDEEYCGGNDVDAVAWYNSNSGSITHPVAQKKANAFGLYDMSGNVWEWVEDCFHRDYNGAPSDGSAWIAGDCKIRVMRGGSLGFEPLRSGFRSGSTPEARNGDIGFRLARKLP